MTHAYSKVFKSSLQCENWVVWIPLRSDEGALVKAAKLYGVTLESRTPQSVVIDVVCVCVCVCVCVGGGWRALTVI